MYQVGPGVWPWRGLERCTGAALAEAQEINRPKPKPKTRSYRILLVGCHSRAKASAVPVRLHPATVRRLTVCQPEIAEFMPVSFLQLTMAQRENIMFKRIKRLVRMRRLLKRRQPEAEEDLGGGDICSLQEQPSTEDDQPLD